MNCHHCGEPLEWDGVRSVVACDICHAFRCVDTPDNSADCIVPLHKPGRFHCPTCRRRMRQAAMDGLKIEHCAGCRGVLLKSNVFAMLVRNRRPEFRDAATQHIFFNERDAQSAVYCPGCRGAMDTHPYLGPNAIIIDSCIGCGMVWLDCRNIATIQQAAVPNGFRPDLSSAGAV